MVESSLFNGYALVAVRAVVTERVFFGAGLDSKPFSVWRAACRSAQLMGVTSIGSASWCVLRPSSLGRALWSAAAVSALAKKHRVDR